MCRRLLIAFLAVFGFLETWVCAEGRSRLRLTTPIAAEYGDIEGATNTIEQGSGYGVEYIFTNGFGLGWSTFTAKAKFDLTIGSTDLSFDQETDTQFLDLSYLFGENLTLQLSYGTLLGGSGKARYSQTTTLPFAPYTFTANLEDEISLQGTAYGLTLGMALGDIELTYGLRLHHINHDYQSSTLSILDGEYDQLYQIAGIGALF
tara:strand:+ start:7754 stop:8368 length:615 start_codon:yes stop_codon:yes gene_type:complete